MPGVERNTVIRGIEPKKLYDVVIDYEKYPGYFTDFTKVRILSKDGDTWDVEFSAKVVKEISYVLRIVHDHEAFKTRWTFVRGQMVTDSRGGWTFTASEGGARIDYDAAIEVNAPLPGFIKRRIQDAILNRSIATLFDQLEKEARRRG
ncbi:MAG: type II toxin-antitoxin system RatA family toxin [Planctomycetota bacterium]|jgi:ribosome-associated toxin RatA of RatAB toxin-antitoxin module